MKKLAWVGFILVFCVSCFIGLTFSGCKDIEEDVDAEFAKYTVDENLAFDDDGYFDYVFLSTHKLYLKELEADKKLSYEDRGFVIYQGQIYFTRTIKRDKKNYPCIYKCDLYGSGIEFVLELDDSNYVASHGYEKTLYLEFNTTKNKESAIIKSYNIETGEYKYEFTGMYVDPYVQGVKKAQRQEALQKLGLEINTNHKKNIFNIIKDGTTIVINKDKLQEYDFGQSIVKYDGEVLFNQVLNGRVFLGYRIELEPVQHSIIILEYVVEEERLLYKGYFKTIEAEHYIDRIDCIRQIN